MTDDKNISKRLDVIIRLLLEQPQNEKMKIAEQLMLLDSAGLSSGDIGKILGRESKNIASSLNTLKKKKASKKKKSK